MSNNKLVKLMSKKEQIEKQIKLQQNLEKATERKQDTRRKILIGAAILSQIKSNKFSKKQLNEILDCELKNEKERSIFGLENNEPQL